MNKFKLASLLTAFALLGSSAAYAWPGHSRYGGSAFAPRYYAGPRVVVAPRFYARVPFGAVRIYAGPNPYYYAGGTFYSPYNGGYSVVAAPYGAVVPMVPAGASSVVINGNSYLTVGGAYYQFDGARNAYVVVPPPL